MQEEDEDQSSDDDQSAGAHHELINKLETTVPTPLDASVRGMQKSEEKNDD